MAKLQSLLLQPTPFSVIGDPNEKKFLLHNGTTQGKRDATGLWSMYIDPLLYILDPHQTGMVVTASADDVTLHPGSEQELQMALTKCDEWAWENYASWCPDKCKILVPTGKTCKVQLSGKQIPVQLAKLAPPGVVLGCRLRLARTQKLWRKLRSSASRWLLDSPAGGRARSR